jgi:hypothetical protein
MAADALVTGRRPRMPVAQLLPVPALFAHANCRFNGSPSKLGATRLRKEENGGIEDKATLLLEHY